MSLDFPKILRLQAAGLAIELAAADKPALISIWLPCLQQVVDISSRLGLWQHEDI